MIAMINDSNAVLASWIIRLEESAFHSFILHTQLTEMIILPQSKLLDIAKGEPNNRLCNCLKNLSIRNIYVTIQL
jgi:hypothetical protein